MPTAKEKVISDSRCAWRGQGCKEKPSGPVWLLLCGCSHHDTDFATRTDASNGTHKQDGAEGMAGNLRRKLHLQEAETRGGSPEALTSQGGDDADLHPAGRPACLQGTATVES